MSTELASALLMKNGWRSQAAIDALLRQDINYIQNEFGFTLEEGAQNFKESKEEAEFTCGCCFCPAEPEETVQMPDCGHRLCDECFSGYC